MYDDDYYSIDLYHMDSNKRIEIFLNTFNIKNISRKPRHNYNPELYYMPKNKNIVDPIKVERVEYCQFEMPVSRFRNLVEVFCFNKVELKDLREKAERANKEKLLRKKFPSLQRAYEQYQLVLNMVETEK